MLKAWKSRFRRILRKVINGPNVDNAGVLEIGSFAGFEVAYRKGTADERVIAHSFDEDIFFQGASEYQAAGDHIIIDIGAHIGTFSLLVSSMVQRGKVFSIEACKDSFNLLRINVALNSAENISAHHLAIMDKKGTCRLSYDTEIGNWGHSVVSQVSDYGEEVEACSLENFLDENNIDNCHFMKVNCEGAEFPILLNTPGRVLHRFEKILVLYHCDLWADNSEKDLLAHFEASGFKTRIFNQSEKRGWIIATNAL